jgi:hypothetical protein
VPNYPPRSIQGFPLLGRYWFIVIGSIIQAPAELLGGNGDELINQLLGLLDPIRLEQPVNLGTNFFLRLHATILTAQLPRSDPRICG